MEISNLYTSIACNRHPTCLDYKENLGIIYGANHAIAYFQLEDPNRNVQTFVKHKSQVLTVKWIENCEKKVFVSGSNDKNAIVWDISDKTVLTCILEGHNGPIITIETASIQNEIFIASSSTDHSIRLWKSCGDGFNFACFQTIPLSYQFCFAIKLFVVPDQVMLLFSEGEQLKLWGEVDDNFREVLNLPGHGDWIRCIDAINDDQNILILTGSQDNYARVWKLSSRKNALPESTGIHMEEKIVSIKNCKFAVSLESVISGHEGWVYTSNFFKSNGRIGIMTCSIDKSIIVWYQGEDGIWMDTHRIGEMGGGNLGFLGAKMSSNGNTLVAQGFHGSLHIWTINQSQDGDIIKREKAPSGHFGAVTDIAWAPRGEFLLSLSSDQTTRIHAPCKNFGKVKWNEIARAQIHGYDLTSIAVLSSYVIATGAEEKVIRILSTTENFISTFKAICSTDNELDSIPVKSLPKCATVPSLGLSNKVLPNISEGTFSNEPDIFEEDLMQSTLWPETNKLYGHGFEIYSLASSNGGRLLASASRSTTPEHSKIIIWDTESMKELQRLSGHNLTVTDLKFSPDNKYLLSTSRDRSWCVFSNTGLDLTPFQLESKSDKKSSPHTRIIWSCDWTFDSKMFATTSRDGIIAIWIKEEEWKVFASAKLENESITAVSFSHNFFKGQSGEYLLAAGLESGKILLYALSDTLKLLYTIGNDDGHHMTVKKLQWRPFKDCTILSSCGEDGLVRIYNVNIL